MDLNYNTDKKIIETKNVAISPANLDTLWSIFEKNGINLPIYSMEARIKFDGIIMYWLKLTSESEIKKEEKK